MKEYKAIAVVGCLGLSAIVGGIMLFLIPGMQLAGAVLLGIPMVVLLGGLALK